MSTEGPLFSRTVTARGDSRLPCRRYLAGDMMSGGAAIRVPCGSSCSDDPHRSTSAPARLVVFEHLLQLRLLGRVGAERQVELVVAGTFLDVSLPGEGDPHAPVHSAQHRIRGPGGE